jgi:hypothetical protein
MATKQYISNCECKNTCGQSDRRSCSPASREYSCWLRLHHASGLRGSPFQRPLCSCVAIVENYTHNGSSPVWEVPETAAIPFTMSNAIKLAIADSRDDVRRPDKASATRVPRLKRTNHHFLLITSWKRLIAFRQRCYHPLRQLTKTGHYAH